RRRRGASDAKGQGDGNACAGRDLRRGHERRDLRLEPVDVAESLLFDVGAREVESGQQGIVGGARLTEALDRVAPDRLRLAIAAAEIRDLRLARAGGRGGPSQDGSPAPRRSV